MVNGKNHEREIPRIQKISRKSIAAHTILAIIIMVHVCIFVYIFVGRIR